VPLLLLKNIFKQALKMDTQFYVETLQKLQSLKIQIGFVPKNLPMDVLYDVVGKTFSDSEINILIEGGALPAFDKSKYITH